MNFDGRATRIRFRRRPRSASSRRGGQSAPHFATQRHAISVWRFSGRLGRPAARRPRGAEGVGHRRVGRGGLLGDGGHGDLPLGRGVGRIGRARRVELGTPVLAERLELCQPQGRLPQAVGGQAVRDVALDLLDLDSAHHGHELDQRLHVGILADDVVFSQHRDLRHQGLDQVEDHLPLVEADLPGGRGDGVDGGSHVDTDPFARRRNYLIASLTDGENPLSAEWWRNLFPERRKIYVFDELRQ